MFSYIVKRLLLFIPTLLIISLAAFTLSNVAPGDPVELRLSGGMQSSQAGQSSEFLAGERAYREKAEELGYDKPVFYFSIHAAAYPDTLYRIPKQVHRETLDRLIYEYGNWPQIEAYYHNIREIELALFGTGVTTADEAYTGQNLIRDKVGQLYLTPVDEEITIFLEEIQTTAAKYPQLSEIKTKADVLAESYQKVKDETTTSKLYFPKFSWYGFDNQYHNWITDFIQLDFGTSILDDRSVWGKVSEAIRWTLVINIFAIFLSYLISVPLGVFQAVHKDGAIDRSTTAITFMLYSLPNFWVAVLLLVFFTTPDYGEWTDIFDSGLPKFEENTPFYKMVALSLWNLVLPVFCSTYRSFAFISRQMRGAMLNVISQDYIRTAEAKGLARSKVIWKHAFRNSLIPIITMFAVLFPAAIAGSVVIELIFSIPGMGSLFLSSITSRDWPVVFTIMMFSAILTLVGNLVADFLYTVVDPRISFTKK